MPFPKTHQRNSYRHRGLLILLVVGWLEPGKATDLNEVIELALLHSPSISAQRFNNASDIEYANEAFAALLPQVVATADPDRTRGDVGFYGQPPAQRNFTSSIWSIKLTQPILKPVAAVEHVRAKQKVIESDLKLRRAMTTEILNAAQAYFDLLNAIAQLQVSAAGVESAKARLESERSSLSAGLTADNNAQTALVSQIESLVDGSSARETLEEKLQLLALITQASLTQVTTLADEDKSLPPDEYESLDEWLGCSRYALDVLIKRSEEVQAQESIRSEYASALPTVDLTLSRTRDRQGGNLDLPIDDNTKTTSTTLGLQISVPLFAGGATVARVRQAENQRQAASAEREDAELKSRGQASVAWFALTRDRQQILLLQDALGSAGLLEKYAGQALKVGRALPSDVSAARLKRLQLQTTYDKIRYDAVMQQLKLKASCGLLSLETIAAVNAWLAAHGAVSSVSGI